PFSAMRGGSLLLLLLFSFALCSPTYGEEPKSDNSKKESDKDAEKEDATYNFSFSTIVCSILNMATVVVILKTLNEARKIPDLMDKYRLSMHWLSRTAIRHSIGPNAKKILVEYVEAKEKEDKEKKAKEIRSK
ncbi:hypothetical protein PFISCL1PPCAC_8789, partial [Pristionchus fissidentatus]